MSNNNVWDDEPSKPVRPAKPQKPTAPVEVSRDFDLEGLMTDFPTATDLERFVFDQTQVVLNLKGRANKLKYQVAMEVLNGAPVDPKFIGHDNPYLEKTDLVPEEPMKELPPRGAGIPSREYIQNEFFTAFVPHSDPEYRAQGRKMHVTFRKYKNGVITYQIMGPVEQVAIGSRLNKYGQVQPEKYSWLDPRTEELLMRRADGTFTEKGRGLYTYCVGEKGAGIWSFIDRDMVSVSAKNISDPWA
mgnify:CR=1 FL=1